MRAQPSYPPRRERLRLEPWLVVAVVLGCLLVALVAYSSYLIATTPIS